MLSLCALLTATIASAQAGDYAVRQQWTLDQAGRWDYLDIDTVRNRLFLTRGDRVQVLDLPSGKVAGQITGLQTAHGVAFAQKLGQGFASSGGANSVVVFDLATLKTLREVPVSGANPDAILYEEGSGKLYVFNGKTANVSVFDAATMKPLATIAVGGRPEFAVSDGKRVYFNIEDKGAVGVIDIAGDRMLAAWPLAGCEEPTGIALDAVHARLFSVCQNGVLAVTDARDGKAVARGAIGKKADAVVFDAAGANIFSSNGDGTLSIVHQVDADHYGAAATVRTEKGARTLAMDHASGRLYLPTLVDKVFTVIVAAP
jgi:YVTN family beta-propeller protein